MTHSLWNVHVYLMANAAIMLSYVVCRLVLHAKGFGPRISQYQQLTFARVSLVLSIVIFMFMPFLTQFSIPGITFTEVKPQLHHTTHLITRSQEAVAAQLSQVESIPFQITNKTIMALMWTVGFIWFLTRYLQTILALNRFRRSAFCAHHIHHTYVYFADAAQVPFCWSLLRNHYIALPSALLENQSARKLALKHELQHLRQGDTQWLHSMNILKLLCFWNPFVTCWMNWFSELQEFACDEEMIIKKNAAPQTYAKCLVDAVQYASSSRLIKNGVIAIDGSSKTLLFRRINMLFSYQKSSRKLGLITACALSACAIASVAFALNGSVKAPPLTAKDITSLMKQEDLMNAITIKATPEVIAEINRIRNDKQARAYMQQALKRMLQYQSVITGQLDEKKMPHDLMAIPMVESGYNMRSKSTLAAAGIWQIIPSTADSLGLIVNTDRDDRLNIHLDTKAALHYLTLLHQQFGDWHLAAVAYEIGENELERLIKAARSHDAWDIARSPAAPKDLKNYLAMLDASVIIMHKPSLIKE